MITPGAFATHIHDLRGRARLLAAFLAGALGVLAQAPFDFWPVLFFTLPVLVWLIDGLVARHSDERRMLFKSAFATGWAFGFGAFLFGLYWIGKAFLVEAGIYIFLMPIAITLMPAGLALFYALAIALAALYWKPGLSRLLTLAVALALGEWLRGNIFTGFPWNTFGHVFLGEAGLSQLSSLFGPYALSFICILIFAAPAIGLLKSGRRFKPFAVAASVLLLMSIVGHIRLYYAANTTVADVRLRLVQPNIAQNDKWRPGNAGPIFQTMLQLSGLHSAQYETGLKQVTQLIWPETALPFLMARSKQALDGIDRLLPDGTTLITGALRTTNQPTANQSPSTRKVYNNLYVMDDKANIIRTFDKKHLVPFGEYLPLKSTLESIGLRKIVQVRGAFETGKTPRLIKLPNLPPFAPLICYEVAFPQEIIEPGERPQWLLNVTNDAWYGVSTGPYQHFAQARMRAIEQGLPMVRVANTGISGIIDPYGRVQKSLGLATAGIIDAALPMAINPTLYARYGSLIFWLVILCATSIILLTRPTEK